MRTAPVRRATPACGLRYRAPAWLPGGNLQTIWAAMLSRRILGEPPRWRRERSLEATVRRRPDLIEAARAAGLLSRQDEAFLASLLL